MVAHRNFANSTVNPNMDLNWTDSFMAIEAILNICNS